MSSDLTKALNELRAVQPEIEEAREYAEGLAPEIFASGRVRRALKDSGLKFRVNWCRTVITAVLNRLKINAITSTDPACQEAIEREWERNMLALEARSIHEAGVQYGETYVIVWEGEDEGTVDIHHNTPAQVRLFYSEENPRVKKYGVKAWVNDESRHRVNLYYRDRIERYISKAKVTANSTGDDYVEFVENEGDDWPIINPYDKIPIFHFKTQFPQGRPEHKDAYGPQNALNKLVVSQMSTVDFQVFPQRYALAEAGKPSGDAPEADEYFGDEEVGESTDPELQAGAGTVWWLDGIKQVGQLEPAKPESFLAPANFHIQAMSTVTDTPSFLFELGGDQPSGESRRRAMEPLVEKVGNRQLAFGATWKEIFKFVLEIIGFTDPDVQVTWSPAQTTDDKESWETVKAKIDAGVPVKVALMEAGYTKEEVDEWFGPGMGPAKPTEEETQNTLINGNSTLELT